MAASRPKVKWRKVLYENQDVPDNYVDESFLLELKKNVNTITYEYKVVLFGSGVLTQQISSICIFVILFAYMDAGHLSSLLLFCISAVLTFFGYCMYEILDKQSDHQKHHSIFKVSKNVVVFLAFGYGLSPILVTLTDTISTDTTYAMTTLSMLANLIFHDYGANAAIVSKPISFNAAIFGSVCLASRLPSSGHAFVLLTCAVEIFGLWPLLRKLIKDRSKIMDISMTIILGVSAILCVYSVSVVCSILLFLLLIFITFIATAWFICLQPHKNNIYGPWDEAIIQE